MEILFIGLGIILFLAILNVVGPLFKYLLPILFIFGVAAYIHYQYEYTFGESINQTIIHYHDKH